MNLNFSGGLLNSFVLVIERLPTAWSKAFPFKRRVTTVSQSTSAMSSGSRHSPPPARPWRSVCKLPRSRDVIKHTHWIHLSTSSSSRLYYSSTISIRASILSLKTMTCIKYVHRSEKIETLTSKTRGNAINVILTNIIGWDDWRRLHGCVRATREEWDRARRTDCFPGSASPHEDFHLWNSTPTGKYASSQDRRAFRYVRVCT